MAQRKRSGLRRVLWAAAVVFSLAIVLVTAVVLLAPTIVAWQIRSALADVWTGEVHVDDVGVGWSGRLTLGSLRLKDTAGQDWLAVDDVEVTLSRWPSLAPRVSKISVGSVRGALWVRDGKITWPVRQTEGEAKWREYLDVSSVQIGEISCAVRVQDGASAGVEGLTLAGRREGGQLHLSLSAGDGGEIWGTQSAGGERVAQRLGQGHSTLRIDATLDRAWEKLAAEVVLKHNLQGPQSEAVLRALGLPDGAQVQGTLSVQVKSGGRFDEAGSWQWRGEIVADDPAYYHAGAEVARGKRIAVTLDGWQARLTTGALKSEIGQLVLDGTSVAYDQDKESWTGRLQAVATLYGRGASSGGTNVAASAAPATRPAAGGSSFWAQYPALGRMRGSVAMAGVMRLAPAAGQWVQIDPAGTVDLYLLPQADTSAAGGAVAAGGAGPAGGATVPGGGAATGPLRLTGQFRGEGIWLGPAGERGSLGGVLHVSGASVAAPDGVLLDQISARVEPEDWLRGTVALARATGDVGWVEAKDTKYNYDADAGRLTVTGHVRGALVKTKAVGALSRRVPALMELTGSAEAGGTVVVEPGAASPLQLDLTGRADLWGATKRPFFQPPARAAEPTRAAAGDAAGAAGTPKPAVKPQLVRGRGSFTAKLAMAGSLAEPRRWQAFGTVQVSDADLHTPEGWIAWGAGLRADLTGLTCRISQASAVSDALSSRLDGTTLRYDPEKHTLHADVAVALGVHVDPRLRGFWSHRLGLHAARGEVRLRGPVQWRLGKGKGGSLAYDLRGSMAMTELILPPPRPIRATNLTSQQVRVANGHVSAAGVQGTVYGGQVQADLVLVPRVKAPAGQVLRAGFGVRNVDAAQLDRALGSTNPTKGTLWAKGQLVVVLGRLDTLSASATVLLDDGEAWNVPVLSGLFAQLGLARKKSDVEVEFTMAGPVLTVKSARAANVVSALVAEPGGTVNVQTRQVDMYVAVVPIKQARNLLADVPILKILVSAGDKLIRARVKGDWRDPPAKLVTSKPLDTLAENTLGAVKEIGKGGGQLGKGLFQSIDKLLNGGSR